MADVVIAYQPFVIPASLGVATVTNTSLGGLTPKAVLIFMGDTGDTDTPETASARLLVGMAANGSGSRCVSNWSPDALATTGGTRRWRNDRALVGADGATNHFSATCAFVANGVQLTFATNSAGFPGRRMVAMLIAGADVTAFCGDLTLTAGANPLIDVTAPGFTPDLVFLASIVSNTATNTNANANRFSFGIGDRNGVNKSIHYAENNGIAAGSQPIQAIFNNVSFSLLDLADGSIDLTGVCTAFDASGFSVQATGTAAGEIISYLALKLGGRAWSLFDFAVPVATGVHSETAPGFSVGTGLIVSSSQTAVNASAFDTAAASGLGMSGFDSFATAYAYAMRVSQTADPTDTASFLKSATALIIGNGGDIDATIATLDALTATGWDLNYTAVSGSATLSFALAIEGTTPPPADARVSQAARLTLAEMAVNIRVSQLARLALLEMEASVRVSQVARLTLAAYSPCHTRRAQLWKITRTDGLQLAFTSHDRPVPYGALSYSPCDSLQATASQQSAEVDGIGNVELQGIISDDAISELDIEAGKYDDAYVEVFLVAWEDIDDGVVSVDSVYRLVAGWVGTVSAGERGFIMEVLGPGQRLAQKTILNVYGPGCRWNLGDADCGVDIEALKLTGTITAVKDNGEFTLDVSTATADAQFDQGFVRWLTGDNAGVDTEIKTVAFETGDTAQVVLWAIAPFLPQVGDTVEVFPGCDRSAATCLNVYDNMLEFGGYDKVPGNDEISKTPDAKF